MEDPDVDWEIEEYSSSNQSNSKVGWIWSKGLWLGKKAVLTGVVISSAPLVLPPLVVFSTLGLACSVPFGLVFVSYACTEKLMSKLLPSPTPSFMLGDGTICNDENLEEDLVEFEEQGKVGFRKEVILEQEEEEQMEDAVDSVLTRIELDEKYSCEFGGASLRHGAVYGQNDVESHEKNPVVEYKQTEDNEMDGMNINEFEGRYILQNGAEYGKNDAEIHKHKPMDEEVQMDDINGGIVRRNELEEKEIYEVEQEDLLQVGHNADERCEQKTLDQEEEMGNIAEGGRRTESEKDGNEVERDHFSQEGPEYRKNDEVKHEEKPMEVLDESVEEGYEEDVGEYLEGEDESTLEGIEMRNKEPIIKKDENKESLIKIRQVVVTVGGGKKSAESVGVEKNIGNELVNVVLVAKRVEQDTASKKNVVDSGDEEVIRESTGLEKIKDEGIDKIEKSSQDSILNEEKVIDEVAGIDMDNNEVTILVENKSVEEAGNSFSGETKESKEEVIKPMEKNNVSLEKFLIKMKGADEDKLGKQISEEFKDMRDIRIGAPDVVEHFQEVGAKDRNANDTQIRLAAERPIGDSNGIINEKNLEGLSGTILEEQKAVSGEEMRILKNNILNDEREDVLEKKKNIFIHPNEELREIADESGLDLLNNSTAKEYSYPEESENVTGSMAEDSEFHDLPLSKGVTEFKCTKLASTEDPATPSSKELLGEEKIWEQIDALRAIVGYKAAMQSSSIEELKALYIFTGVEPPPSSKDYSDLAELNRKLRFLKSIVGVK